MSDSIVVHNLLSIRCSPDSNAELVSQALFGERLTVLETEGTYSQIRTADGYEGWALTQHIGPYAPGRFRYQRIVTDQFTDIVSSRADGASVITRLPAGSFVNVEQDSGDYTRVMLPETAVFYSADAFVATRSLSPVPGYSSSPWPVIRRHCYKFIGTPYLWGGTSSFGIDCSGFVQRVFGLCGIHLPRDAYLQAASDLGQNVPAEDQRIAMDLVFFLGKSDPHKRGITHVGIALDDERFVHASGENGVIVSSFSDSAIREQYTYVGGLRIDNYRIRMRHEHAIG